MAETWLPVCWGRRGCPPPQGFCAARDPAERGWAGTQQLRAWWPPSPLRDISIPSQAPQKAQKGGVEQQSLSTKQCRVPPFPPGTSGLGPWCEQLKGVQPPMHRRGAAEAPHHPQGSPRAEKAQPQLGKSRALLGELISPTLAGARHQGEDVHDVPEDSKFSAPLRRLADHFSTLR